MTENARPEFSQKQIKHHHRVTLRLFPPPHVLSKFVAPQPAVLDFSKRMVCRHAQNASYPRRFWSPGCAEMVGLTEPSSCFCGAEKNKCRFFLLGRTELSSDNSDAHLQCVVPLPSLVDGIHEVHGAAGAIISDRQRHLTYIL